jgi:hypothetical protein
MMVDVATTTHVREDPLAPPYQGGNDLEQTVEVWKRAGDAFAGGGGGFVFAWSPGRAAFVELALESVFPFAAVVLSPSAGLSLGF